MSAHTIHITIINGANLNLLGRRDATLYGTLSMEQVVIGLQQRWPDVQFTYLQSNHEGDLIDWLQTNESDGVILNAGGYSHTSVALRDAVELCQTMVVEVHITNILQREPFRQTSLLSPVCRHSIIGHGTNGYAEAVEYIITHNTQQ